MISAEAQHPTIYIKSAFITVYYRFTVFFVFRALTVRIVTPYNYLKLVEVYLGRGSTGTAGASPYVITMETLGIGVLPHVVNALVLTSIFSASNTYTYYATRTLHSLALEGRAPKFLRRVNKRGTPIYYFLVVMVFPLLSFLQVSSSSAIVITWLVAIITGGGLISFVIMSITFLNYYKACQVQGVDRKTQPYYSYFQPYGAWITLGAQATLLFVYGYTAFRPWNLEIFFQNYSIQILACFLFLG